MKIPWFFLKNARKPKGIMGKLFVRHMNREHLPLTNWGLDCFAIKEADSIVDIGCGGGLCIQNIDRAGLAKHIYGVDYSQTSVDCATKRNSRAIAEGRVTILKGSVSDLPFDDKSIDYAISVESYYFWPEFIADLKEIRRILKPDGEFMLVAELYKNDSNTNTQKQYIEDLNMRNLSLEEFRQSFLSAGFRNIRIICHDIKGWICVIGIK